MKWTGDEKLSKAGLYFHIPFCRSKCPYCDFYSIPYKKQLAEEYADRLMDEMKKYTGSFDTIYFGGGTPSLLAPALIGKILDAAKNQFDIDADSEITIECNPSKDLSENFRDYRSYGVNRISLGMQSAVDQERRAIGRSADKNQIAKTIQDARNAGIENISLDFMLGIPAQTLASLDETFEFIDKMKVEHLSAYMLKIEEGTVFYKMKNKLNLPDEDLVCDMYLKTVESLRTLGLEQYEISNFAKPGFESRHNIKYWTLAPYLGLGASAHSFWHGKRFYYDQKLQKVADGDGGDLQEQIMLGLRLTQGIDAALVDKDITAYLQAGLMQKNNGRIALTPQGMLVSNQIIGDLL